MAKISIVSSVYNKEPFIERSLKSFLSQTYDDIEIILINNGSTDNSGTIINKFATIDNRIHIINLVNNIGPSGAYKLGIDSISGDYFTLCDADDYIPSNYIEILYNEMIKHSADIVMCTSDRVWDDGKVEILKRPPQTEIIYSCQDIPSLLPQIIDHHSNQYLGYYLPELGSLWGKLYKTSFVKENQVNYDENVWKYCDWLFNFQLVKRLNKLVYTEDTLYHFYQSNESFTRPSSMNWKEKERRILVLDKFESECLGNWDEKLRLAMFKFYYRNISELFDLYFCNFPKEVSLNDLRNSIKDIVKKKEFGLLFKKGSKSLGFKDKVIVFLFKNNILLPLIIYRKFR